MPMKPYEFVKESQSSSLTLSYRRRCYLLNEKESVVQTSNTASNWLCEYNKCNTYYSKYYMRDRKKKKKTNILNPNYYFLCYRSSSKTLFCCCSFCKITRIHCLLMNTQWKQFIWVLNIIHFILTRIKRFFPFLKSYFRFSLSRAHTHTLNETSNKVSSRHV